MTDQRMPPSIWVVFSDDTDLLYLRWLRRGFRHCFAVLRDGDCWLSFDPMAHRSEVRILDVLPDFDVPTWLAQQGYVVVAAASRPEICRPLLPMPFTCVEAIKRLIGLRAPGVLTPWQLYRVLCAA